jgi:hypothetical protein
MILGISSYYKCTKEYGFFSPDSSGKPFEGDNLIFMDYKKRPTEAFLECNKNSWQQKCLERIAGKCCIKKAKQNCLAFWIYFYFVQFASLG